MLNNLLYLVDTNTISLIVTLYTMTVNRNGQLVLRFVQDLGALCEIDKFFSDEAYIAVMENEYQSQTSEFVRSVVPDKTQSYIVSAVIKNGTFTDLHPFGIKICKNKAMLSHKERPVGDNDYVVMAALNYASVKAQNDVLTIITGDSKNCNLYEFIYPNNADHFELSKIPRENKIELDNTPKVNPKLSLTLLGDKIISYQRIQFDNDWRKHVLSSINDFFLEEDEKLIPRIDGIWEREYIDGLSFPYMRYFNKIPNKTEWQNFLKNKENFPVSLEEIKKAS